VRERVRVTVPATTANLGPGFDCLAVALQIYSTFTAEMSDHPQVIVMGEGAEAIQSASDNLVLRAMQLVFDQVGRPFPALSLTIDNRIPIARGLGSSAAAAVAGLVAANALLGDPLNQDQIALLACELEGHPDNVGAAIFGGCVVSVVDGHGLLWAQVPMPEDLRAVLLIPEFAMPTQEARSVLPAQVGRDVAIYNIARASLLVASLATGQLQHLRTAMQDQLHQPSRQTIFPAMSAIFDAALESGALGVALSGAGSTILALTREREEEIGAAMVAAAETQGLQARSATTRPSVGGVQIEF